MGKTVAIGAGVVYGAGALVQLGLQIQKAMAGTGRSVYLSDVGNAFLWPLSFAHITLIPAGGPVLVQGAAPPPPPVNDTVAGRISSIGSNPALAVALNQPTPAQQIRDRTLAIFGGGLGA